ncbi:phosphoribosylformylglycinamidine synthase subunit PurL [Methanophagales archaeon]|nr:MAG: phosphoribosylformylglycinamidine synthase subunit PurL [Methanophagales archaeon]
MERIEVRAATDGQLKRISDRMGLSLNLEEMQRVKHYFVVKGREPTGIELQSIAQSWSEHCCYKSSKTILKEFIFGINAPQNMLVIEEDAGVVEFDNEHAYVLAFESHNHPSAVEPYGGAATGIGGIVRDVICMGAQPVALIDPLLFGPLDYPDEKVPEGIKHPRFLFNGVVSGISDYGNRIGIPTCAGMIYFHDGYVGNCVVNVGCVGIMKKADLCRSRAKPDEMLVLVGGKTGRDGIHGVTFASVELTGEEESRSAVQVGDPITKEPLMHAIHECNAKGLLSGMKDLGGGGLSCAVNEMCNAGGCSAEIQLDAVKLKEAGLDAWEIWVSESQERFLIAVQPEKEAALIDIFDKWDVDAVVIGHTFKNSLIKSGMPQVRIYLHGEQIFELDTDFLVACPVYERPRTVRSIEAKEERAVAEPDDYNETLLMLLKSLNISSKEAVIRQYDHEVRGSTIIKPLQGLKGRETHGDATVIKPLENSYKGLAITSDVNPSFCQLNQFWGAASVMDEVCRNLTAVGAVAHSFADCLNFGNPEKPDRMGEFYECCRGLGYMASALGIPFVSGNVSLYNESTAMMSESIPPTPTVLGIGLCEDVRECVTVDMKETGNLLYVIGDTNKELGGSEYYRLRGVEGLLVPRTKPEVLKKRMGALLGSMQEGHIASCHDVSEGGLAAAVCEMLIGGDIGARIDIAGVNTILRSDYKLFSESNTRWVVEVWAEDSQGFEALMAEQPVIKIGETVAGKRVEVYDGKRELMNLSVDELRTAWRGMVL